jgi:hypothetical protein
VYADGLDYYDVCEFFDGKENADGYAAYCEYDSFWMEWYCDYAPTCYALYEGYVNADGEGVCLDSCEYGYDEEACVYSTETYYYECECRTELYVEEESEWDMFTETPYRCDDPFWCALTPPGSDPTTWSSYEDAGLEEWRHGYFDNSGEAYATCVDVADMLENYEYYKLFEGETTKTVGTTSSDSTSIDVTFQSVTYLCYEGRALEIVDSESDGVDSDDAVAALEQLMEVFTDTFTSAADSGLMTTSGCTEYTTVEAAMTSIDNTAVDGETCASACFMNMGVFMSQMVAGECSCIDAPFEATCSDANEDATNAIWTVTAYVDNSTGPTLDTVLTGDSSLWSIVAGAVAEEAETFDDKYPHCLPSTELDEDAIYATACEYDNDCADQGDYGTCNSYGFCANDSNVAEFATEIWMIEAQYPNELLDVGILWVDGYYDDSDDW